MPDVQDGAGREEEAAEDKGDQPHETEKEKEEGMMAEIRRRRKVTSASRYEDAGEVEYALMQRLREQYFDQTRNAKVKILFDGKRSMRNGKLTLGRIRRTDELLKHLTRAEAESMSGFDYIIMIDRLCWTRAASNEDRTRIMRHELRHMLFNPSRKDPFQLRPHDVEDFSEELELNTSDPAWCRRLVESTLALYDEEKERERE